MKILKFPKNFLWGVSTSAYQIEGGINNDWSEWEKMKDRIKKLEAGGKITEDFICGQACDSYNRYEEDLALVKNLNCGAFRVGVEWARIEPEQGKFNRAEIEHYRQVLMAFKQRNIKSAVTLWHWTSPVWFAGLGGWSNINAVKFFTPYVELMVKELGGLIDFWVTINEPMAYLYNSFYLGIWPPNKKSIFLTRQAYSNLIKAHKESYGMIHGQYPKASVGLTMLANNFQPAHDWNFLEIIFAKLANHFWNDRLVMKLKGDYDFLGLDYYFHDRIIWRPPFIKNLNKEVTDMGWEIYPAGIERVLKNYAKFKKPLFIMENGLADRTDGKRMKFITDHLRYVHQALKQGVQVRGYFYWSLLDNFEWDKGFGPKFGLFSVDRKTFKRTARPSAKLFGEICKNNRLKVD